MNSVVVTTNTRVKRECLKGAIEAHIIALHEQLFYSGNRCYSEPLERAVSLITGLVGKLTESETAGEIDVVLKSVLKSEIEVEHVLFENETVSIIQSI